MPTPKEQCEFIYNYMNSNKNTYKTKLEIMANTLLMLAMEQLNINVKKPMNEEEFLTFITEHRKQHGETLGNALAIQAMLMLNWLRRKDE